MTGGLQLTTLLRRLGCRGAAHAAEAAAGWVTAGGAGMRGNGSADGASSPGAAGDPVLDQRLDQRLDQDLARVLDRARAAGVPEDACVALGVRWPELDNRVRAQVTDPLRPREGTDTVRWGTAAARQTDGTSCGSAVLVMLAAAGDPLLALWLACGERCAGYLPAELQGTDPALDQPGGRDADAGTAARFTAAQHAVGRLSRRRAVPRAPWLPWPSALGTPPWGAARIARFPGVTYRSVLLDDTREAELAAVLDRAGRALDHGVPVPLYVGGDLSTGITTAVPRHVVLLTARRGDLLSVYDPSDGRVHHVTGTSLVAPAGPAAALGGWTHVCWALLPVRRPLR